MAKKDTSLGIKIAISALLLFGLMIIGSIAAVLIAVMSDDSTSTAGANVAVIPIEGVIMASGESNAFAGIVSSDTLMSDIADAQSDRNIKAVMFMINSPGGSAVASDEIARAILDIEKPSVAVIREAGASGAYWAASSTDHIIANRMSVTGSIGVISSYLSFGEFLDDWNVTYNRLVSGNRKDVGSPFRELDISEEEYLQQKLDRIHNIFIREVAHNRNMSYELLAPYADGSFYLGIEAIEIGLIDELGGESEAIGWLEERIGEEVVLVEYSHEPSFFDILSSLEGEMSIPTMVGDVPRIAAR